MAHVQVAPDSTGKKVIMEDAVLPDGTAGVRQVANFGGESLIILTQLLENSTAQLRCLRALVQMMSATVVSSSKEEDF